MAAPRGVRGCRWTLEPPARELASPTTSGQQRGPASHARPSASGAHRSERGRACGDEAPTGMWAGAACVGMRMHPRPRSTPARPRATPTHPPDAEHVWRSRGSLGLGRRHRLRGPRRPTQHRDDLRRAVRAGAGGARAAQPSTAIVAVQQLPVRADLPSITRHGHLQDKGAHGIW